MRKGRSFESNFPLLTRDGYKQLTNNRKLIGRQLKINEINFSLSE